MNFCQNCNIMIKKPYYKCFKCYKNQKKNNYETEKGLTEKDRQEFAEYCNSMEQELIQMVPDVKTNHCKECFFEIIKNNSEYCYVCDLKKKSDEKIKKSMIEKKQSRETRDRTLEQDKTVHFKSEKKQVNQSVKRKQLVDRGDSGLYICNLEKLN